MQNLSLFTYHLSLIPNLYRSNLKSALAGLFENFSYDFLLKSMDNNLLSQFLKNGFVIIREFINPAEVEKLLLEYDMFVKETLEQISDLPKGLIYIDNPTDYNPHWKNYEYFKKALSTAEILLNGKVFHKEDEIIIKLPKGLEKSPWHQDAAYWERLGVEITQGVVCWLALSKTSPQNGGLQFLKGLHQGELIEHKDVSSLWKLPEAIEARIDDKLIPEQIYLNPGDATFHHYKTPHFSDANGTTEFRKALTTHFWKI